MEIPLPLPVEDVEIGRDRNGYLADEVDIMDWEDELHEDVDAGNVRDVRGWNKLRKQTELDLKEGEKTLPVSQTTKFSSETSRICR